MPKVKLMKRRIENGDNFAEGVAFGHCKTWLEFYAAGIGVPAAELTTRVAALLLSASSGPLHGPVDNLSALRGSASAGNKATRKMEMARRPHRRKAQVTHKKPRSHPYWKKMTPEQRSQEMSRRRRLNKGPSPIKQYWAKMTPEARTQEMLRRRQVALSKKAA